MTREQGSPQHYARWLAAPHARVRAGLARLHPWLAEFLIFGFKQGWAALFGGVMLALLIGTKLVWRPDWPIARYDALTIAAVGVQALFLATRLESVREAKVILLFHAVGTGMELFKTQVGSWAYPEPSVLRIGEVPLFSGFMYACVGSYIARVTRIFDLRYVNAPANWLVLALGCAIYVNFFTHHYLIDLRPLLFVWAAAIWFRTRIYFTVDVTPRWMPLLLAAALTAFFIWIGENVGTLTGTWLYPTQRVWHVVSFGKFGAWFLLIVLSFALVSLVHPPRAPDQKPAV
ncbi:DUF817 domain-containing protein [Methylopila sp. M107]|uniref:DUF817 domain-containing protein n=1 Tax=Methylopila sp. M107 TaxID=1101190 RepID=UPI000368E7A3|nr:DUF817 domain-containing protein [Methylopila sp. M107]